MKTLVLGYGNIGSVLAQDLARSLPQAHIVIAGKHQREAEEAAAALHQKNVTGTHLNASNNHELIETMKQFNLVVGALPENLGFRSIKAAIEAKVNMVDISFMPENPLILNDDATKAGVTIIPDCGVAPGLSNMLVGHALIKLNQVTDVNIMVGGLPDEPVPPLDYTTTWSIEGLVHEYTRKAKIVKNGKTVEVEALTGLEKFEFPDVGKLEGFYTDGLRTLLHTVNDVQNMWEKTLRYPGHAQKIKLLKSLGFFDELPIKVGNTSVSPRMITVKLLGKKLTKPEVRDLLVMRVDIKGVINRSKRCYSYYLVDHYDQEYGITAMSRTTAYPASIVAQLMAQNLIEEKGVIPPEKLGAKNWFFNKLLAELEKRQIKIVESFNEGS